MSGVRAAAACAALLALAGSGCSRLGLGADRCDDPSTPPDRVVRVAYDAALQQDVDGLMKCLTASGRSRLMGPARADFFRAARFLRSVDVTGTTRGPGWADVSVVLHETSGRTLPATLRVVQESLAGVGMAWYVDRLAVP